MSRAPSVDVVVPCHRYGAVLPIAVRSVLDQPGVDVRVLVIDDASGDGSADVARALAELDSRVEVVEHAVNKGHLATYDEGLLEWCKADYSVLLSADDALTPGALGRATALLDAHPGVGFAYGRPLHWDGSHPLPPARTESRGVTVYPGHTWLRRRFVLGNGCITSPEVVVRTSLQQSLGGYDRRLPHTGDIEMWMRFALAADVGYLRGVDQAYYRVHGANMSTAYYGGSGVLDLQQRLAAYDVVMETAPGLLPDAHELHARLRRTLARDALRRAGRAYDRGAAADEPIAEMIEFARSTVPDVTRLPEWHTLRLRQAITQRVGPRATSALRPLVLTAAGRRVKWLLRDRTWRSKGI